MRCRGKHLTVALFFCFEARRDFIARKTCVSRLGICLDEASEALTGAGDGGVMVIPENFLKCHTYVASSSLM